MKITRKSMVISSRIDPRLLAAVLLDLQSFGHKPLGRSSAFNTLLNVFVKLRGLTILSHERAIAIIDEMYPPRDTSIVKENNSLVANNLNQWQLEQEENISQEKVGEPKSQTLEELNDALKEVQKMIEACQPDNPIMGLLKQQEAEIVGQIKLLHNN